MANSCSCALSSQYFKCVSVSAIIRQLQGYPACIIHGEEGGFIGIPVVASRSTSVNICTLCFNVPRKGNDLNKSRSTCTYVHVFIRLYLFYALQSAS